MSRPFDDRDDDPEGPSDSSGASRYHSSRGSEEDRVPLKTKPFVLNIDPQIPVNGTIGIFGARGTGKTNCLTWILKELKNRYPVVYLFTCTQFNSYWEQFINPDCIINGWNEQVANKILQEQIPKVRAWRAGADINPCAAVILDDCLPKDMQWSDTLRELYFFGRHYMLLSIANSQYFYAIPRGMRSNLDLVISFKQDQFAQIKAFWEDYFCAFGHMEDFREDFENIASKEEGHTFICFYVKDKSVSTVDRIYEGVAPNMEEDEDLWFMGCREVWKDNMEHLQKILEGRIREQALKKIDAEFFQNAKVKKNDIHFVSGGGR